MIVQVNPIVHNTKECLQKGVLEECVCLGNFLGVSRHELVGFLKSGGGEGGGMGKLFQIVQHVIYHLSLTCI